VGDNPIYKAPEALKLSDKYTVEMSNKLDSWALGVMAYKMFEGKFPFDDAFMSKIENKVSKFGSNPKNQVIEGTRAMTPYGELLNGLLHPDPQQRFSIKEALQSSFFNDITQVNESGERVLKPELHALLKQSLNA
jgi:serine/threonine protein kinase